MEDTVTAAARLAATTGDGRKLTSEHYSLIVDWLEVTENFQKLNGSGSRTDSSVRHPQKKTMYNIMWSELQERGFPKFVGNGDNLGKRFVRYQQKYKEALSFKTATGSGLTDTERKAGRHDDSLQAREIMPMF